MKKIIFLLGFGILLSINPVISQVDYFDEFIYDSILIENTVFEKVFPEAEIYLHRYSDALPGTKKVIGHINGKKYYMPSQFNLLFNRARDNSKANIEDKIKAIILIMLLKNQDSEDTSFSILNLIEKDTLIPNGKLYNYRIKYEFSDHLFDLYLKMEKNQPSHILIYYDGRFYFRMYFELTHIIKPSKSINCEILNINPVPIDLDEHYYVIVSENDNNIPNLVVNFEITGLEANQADTYIRVNPVHSSENTFFFEELLSVNSSGSAFSTWDLSNTIYINPTYTDICNIEIYDNLSGTTTVIDNKWLIPEKIKTGVFNQGYNYTLYYCDQFFYDHPSGISHSGNYTDYVKSAIEDCWEKQVNEWNMCYGISNSAGTQTNIPLDNDSNYEIFINDSRGPSSVLSYHGTTFTAALFNYYEIRKIGFGSLIYDYYEHGYNNYTDEISLIRSTLSHEFFHGIQRSFNESYPSIMHDFFPAWMIEGQARFIQSVFMSEYAYPGEEYNIGRLFHKDSREFLGSLNYGTLNYLNLRLMDQNYEYCLFWRFLYENYNSSNDVADKLEIIRETIKGNTSDQEISFVTNLMNSRLNTGGGNFNTMYEVIDDFSKAMYFNDVNYDLWEPNPSDQFYDFVYVEDSKTFNNSEETIFTGNIDNVFGIDYYELVLVPSDDILEVTFEAIDNTDDYFVNCLLYDNSGNLPEDGIIQVTSGYGNETFAVDPSIQKMIIIVIKESGIWKGNGDFEIKIISPNNTFVPGFTASANQVMQGNSITFTNTSTGVPSILIWEWTFEQGSPAFSNSLNPSTPIFYNADVSPGFYNVSLTGAGYSATYSMQIEVIENTVALIADFSSNVQTLPVGNHINFYDGSAGLPTSWLWEFEGGSPSVSYSQNPINILYNEPGNYDVTLTITKGMDSDIETKSGFISVNEDSGSDLFAAFHADITSVNTTTYVSFTDDSYGNPNYWHWTFEDGNPSESWEENPDIYFPTWGLKDVTLEVSNNFGCDIVTYSNYISVFEYGNSADFTIENAPGINCYDLTGSITHWIPYYYWTVYMPDGTIFLTSEDFFVNFCAPDIEGLYTIVMDAYSNGNYIGSVVKYIEICSTDHCSNGYQDCDETAIDCGGLECGGCGSSSDCNDCQKNGNETGIDCGGSCEPCQYSCTHVNKTYTNTNPPPLTHATETIVAGDGWVIVPDGDDVIFRAGNSITLKTGFKAEEGSLFIAQTTPCYCMPICAFVPIVVTPDNNGIDDYFCISVVGANTYELSIWNDGIEYNFETSGEIYDGEFCPWDFPDETQTYLWELDLWSGCSGEHIHQQGSVQIGVPTDNKKNYTSILNKTNPDLYMKVIPNPNVGIFTLFLNEMHHWVEIDLINNIGENVYSKEYFFREKIITDISYLPDGIYILMVQLENQVFFEKIIKQ